VENRRLLSRILVLAISGFMVSCATPIAPTGGPPDNEGPKLEYTNPETGTTNFNGNTFEFQFDEFVRRNSVSGAITVEPDLGINYEVSWQRKKMIIEFEEDFPDSTTLIIKLGTDISDTRRNKISGPITLAISTGDEIDEGKIIGNIRLAKTGKPAEGQRVLLYRDPINIKQKAAYEAQTDTGGTFTFSYLSEGNYRALLVDDRNRNKIWDPQNEETFSFYEEIIRLKKGGSDTLDVLYATRTDSIAPKLQGVGLFSANRIRLRFSEDIIFEEGLELNILDTLGNFYSNAYPLYVSPEEPFVLFAQSNEPLNENESFQVNPTQVRDLASNHADSSWFEFSGSAQEDTTQQRIISSNEVNGLGATDKFEITYAAPITEDEIIDSLVVIEGEVDFNDWPEVSVVRNKLLISPQGEWIDGVDYDFLAWNPNTLRRTLFEPETWDANEYGEIEVNLSNNDSTMSYILQLIGADRNEVRKETLNSTIILSDLPPHRYMLILFKDENKNGKWDRGSVIPYHKPERYYVQNNLNVQEGFTSEVNITFD
jgi:hypothetical protein